MIGDDVRVTVLEVKGDVVRVGIDAPRSVRVHRSELLEAIEATNREAAASSPDGARNALAALSEAAKRRG